MLVILMILFVIQEPAHILCWATPMLSHRSMWTPLALL